jgi:RimJ/RimL family protein N-acetyltransferase
VLEKDQELVGYLLARESAAGVLSFGMALLPGARGSGGGRRLIEALADHALRVGAHKLELQAWTENAPAIAFYAKLGFELEGIRREHYRRRDGTLRSTVVMARRIGSAGEER